nr:hypothetical protein [uncultured Desulfobulbus sp.]
MKNLSNPDCACCSYGKKGPNCGQFPRCGVAKDRFAVAKCGFGVANLR